MIPTSLFILKIFLVSEIFAQAKYEDRNRDILNNFGPSIQISSSVLQFDKSSEEDWQRPETVPWLIQNWRPDSYDSGQQSSIRPGNNFGQIFGNHLKSDVGALATEMNKKPLKVQDNVDFKQV